MKKVNTNTNANTENTVGGITRVTNPVKPVNTNFSAIISRMTENTSKITVVTDVKTQKTALEDNAPKVWTEFKPYLASINYTLTPTKRILCDIGGMTAADYTRLTDFLNVVRACIIDWQSAKMCLDNADISKAKRKEIMKLINTKEKAVYTALKGVKGIFDIEGKCKPSDIEWIANRVITVKYRDRTNIKLGYTLSVSGNMSILSNIFKLVSAAHDGQTALENAQSTLIKKNADGIKSALKELTALETSEAQLETTEN